MFVLIAGFLVSRGVNVKVMPPVLVSICVNVLAAAGCVKFSEVLVSLAFTINTESVLNLRVIEPLCIAPVPCTPCVMSVVLFSVRVATSKSCMCMVTTAIHLACSVSSRHVCYGQCTCTCTCSALYRILTSSFCRLTLYGLSLPVRTRNALQNNGTPAV